MRIGVAIHASGSLKTCFISFAGHAKRDEDLTTCSGLPGTIKIVDRHTAIVTFRRALYAGQAESLSRITLVTQPELSTPSVRGSLEGYTPTGQNKHANKRDHCSAQIYQQGFHNTITGKQ